MSYRSKYLERSRRWERYLELAAEAGSIAMNLGHRPTRVQLAGVALEHVGEVDVDRDHWDGDPDSFRVLLGSIGGERVGWIADGDGGSATCRSPTSPSWSSGARCWGGIARSPSWTICVLGARSSSSSDLRG